MIQAPDPGGCLNIKMLSYQYRIPMLEIRRSCDRLIFNMGITIPEKDSLYFESGLPQKYQTLTYSTHWGLDKMAAILQTYICKHIFQNKKLCILIWISLKFLHVGLISNELTLVQVMARCQFSTEHYLIRCWPSSKTPTMSPGLSKLNEWTYNVMPVMFRCLKWVHFEFPWRYMYKYVWIYPVYLSPMSPWEFVHIILLKAMVELDDFHNSATS